MKVAIIGTGYVGLTTGVALAYLGHEVTCLDVDAAKVEALRRGQVPFFEPHLEELMQMVSARLCYTSEYSEAIPGADVIVISVGTPPLSNGSPDLSYLRAAARSVGTYLGEGFTVLINKSTVPIGSGNWVEALVREAFEERNDRRPGGCFAVASNPEFLREGSALYDSLYPDRVVVGTDDIRAIEVLYDLYRPLIEQTFTPLPFLPRPEHMGRRLGRYWSMSTPPDSAAPTRSRNAPGVNPSGLATRYIARFTQPTPPEPPEGPGGGNEPVVK